MITPPYLQVPCPFQDIIYSAVRVIIMIISHMICRPPDSALPPVLCLFFRHLTCVPAGSGKFFSTPWAFHRHKLPDVLC